MFRVELVQSDEQNPIVFEDMLAADPDTFTPLKKEGNEFGLHAKPTRHRNGLYSGVFSLIQVNNIPPVAKRGKAFTQMQLEEDEGLGHYTSFVYDPSNQIIIVQNNRNGITASGVAAYFKYNFRGDIRRIELKVVINPTDLTQLASVNSIRKVNLSIAGLENGGILANDGVRRSVGELRTLADNTRAQVIQISLGIGYGEGSLNGNVVKNIIRSLTRADDYGSIKKLEIVGRDSDEEALKTIDFITNKVIIDVTLERTRHLNERTIERLIREAINSYQLIKPDIASFRVKNE